MKASPPIFILPIILAIFIPAIIASALLVSMHLVSHHPPSHPNQQPLSLLKQQGFLHLISGINLEHHFDLCSTKCAKLIGLGWFWCLQVERCIKHLPALVSTLSVITDANKSFLGKVVCFWVILPPGLPSVWLVNHHLATATYLPLIYGEPSSPLIYWDSLVNHDNEGGNNLI